jgi:hypothetical protein
LAGRAGPAVAATDAICVSPIRKAEKKHGIKRRAQMAERFPGVLRRAAGALVIKFVD